MSADSYPGYRRAPAQWSHHYRHVDVRWIMYHLPCDQNSPEILFHFRTSLTEDPHCDTLIDTRAWKPKRQIEYCLSIFMYDESGSGSMGERVESPWKGPMKARVEGRSVRMIFFQGWIMRGLKEGSNPAGSRGRAMGSGCEAPSSWQDIISKCIITSSTETSSSYC